MRGTLLVVLLGAMSVAGCKGTPSCEEAINNVAKRVPQLASPKEMAETVAACIKEQWPAELRSCVADARDEPGLGACATRLVAHDQGAPKPPGDSNKIMIAKLEIARYAFEAFPSWSVVHPDKACPDKLEDLSEYINRADTKDPWGRPYRMMCGASLPAGAKGIAVMSVGEDGKEATEDDIKSWE